ncbi:NAD(P)-dependent oxidoreductase [Henriciella litoralis]|uniref:NAD(P)-dependent oxidoreductase n=1 Tax=Henriciella litoralis TaxID=568102 RepID=UPI000A02B091|nr:NAD(P)-dependent oxidoreductase [Henriciella litoralis]
MKQSDISIRVYDGNDEAIVSAIKTHFPEIEVTQEPLNTERRERILVTFRPPSDEDLSIYTWIHAPAAGVDAIFEAISDQPKRPLVTRTIGKMGQQIGEYCVGYSLAYLQKMSERREAQSRKRWDRARLAPTHLFNCDVAILGTGSIGQGIATAFAGFGAQVTGYSRSGRATDGFSKVSKLTGFGKDRHHQIVVSALPSTPDTAGIVSTNVFETLEGAIFINVGRGSTIDEGALRTALSGRQVAQAILDVFETEPLPPTSWLWEHPRVMVTPHVSGLTLPEDSADRLVELLEQALSGKRPKPDADMSRGY